MSTPPSPPELHSPDPECEDLLQAPDDQSSLDPVQICPPSDTAEPAPPPTLRFELVTESGELVRDAGYKTVLAGTPPDQEHIADAMTNSLGQTAIVSRSRGESIDFFLVWPKVTVNRDFFKL